MKLITAALSALFLLIVSTVLRSAELHFMSAALISVPVISYILGRVTVRRLQCRREAPEYVSEGERFCVSLELWGKSRLLGPIEIDDALPEWVERDEDARSRVSQQGPDRIVASYTAAATKRGEYAIGPLRLHISDPLGFFQFACTYSLTSRLVVLPSPLQVPNLHVQAAGSFGEHQFEGSGARGGGTDFDGVREYHQGDELRRVHWPSTARHGRLNVIEFEHAKAEDTVVALDLERGSEIGTGKHSSLEYAVKIGAGLVEQALNLGSMVRLACAGIHGPAAAYGRGLDHLYAVLDALARVQANQTERLSSVLFREAPTFSHNTAVVCLSSYIDPELPQCTRLLASRRVTVAFILLTFSDEIPTETEQMAARLVAAGASLAVVGCSTSSTAGEVKYQYAA